MQYSETYQVLIFIFFLCFLGYSLFSYMNRKKLSVEGFSSSSSSSSLLGGTTNAASYNNAINQLVRKVYNQLYVTNNNSLNQQYIQLYNSNLANFKSLIKTVQAQIPLSIDFDADPTAIGENVVEQMKLLNTLSTGLKNLDTVNYKA